MAQGEMSYTGPGAVGHEARGSAGRRGVRGGGFAVFAAVVLAVASAAAALVWLANSGLLGLVVVLVAVVVGLATWYLVPTRRARRRGRQVRRWALTHGWVAEPAPSRAVIGGSEVLHGVVGGVPVTSCTTVFDPDWRRGLDTSRFRHVLMSALPVDFPVLTIVPTGGVRRPPPGPDDGPSLPLEWSAFNDTWLVQCADPRFASDFCHPRLMERLMEPDLAGLSVLVAGGEVAVHALGPADLGALEARAAVVRDLVRLVPSYLLEQHGARVPTRSRRRVPTTVLRGARPGEATGWPTVIMSAVVLAGVAWLIGLMVRVGDVGFAIGTVAVVVVVAAIPVAASSRAQRRRRMRR